MKCPNINNPEYKRLISALGKEGAYKVYLANNEEIPSSAIVDNIITRLTNKESETIKIYGSAEKISTEETETLGNVKNIRFITDNFLKHSKVNDAISEKIDKFSRYINSNTANLVTTPEQNTIYNNISIHVFNEKLKSQLEEVRHLQSYSSNLKELPSTPFYKQLSTIIGDRNAKIIYHVVGENSNESNVAMLSLALLRPTLEIVDKTTKTVFNSVESMGSNVNEDLEKDIKDDVEGAGSGSGIFGRIFNYAKKKKISTAADITSKEEFERIALATIKRLRNNAEFLYRNGDIAKKKYVDIYNNILESLTNKFNMNNMLTDLIVIIDEEVNKTKNINLDLISDANYAYLRTISKFANYITTFLSNNSLHISQEELFNAQKTVLLNTILQTTIKKIEQTKVKNLVKSESLDKFLEIDELNGNFIFDKDIDAGELYTITGDRSSNLLVQLAQKVVSEATMYTKERVKKFLETFKKIDEDFKKATANEKNRFERFYQENSDGELTGKLVTKTSTEFYKNYFKLSKESTYTIANMYEFLKFRKENTILNSHIITDPNFTTEAYEKRKKFNDIKEQTRDVYGDEAANEFDLFNNPDVYEESIKIYLELYKRYGDNIYVQDYTVLTTFKNAQSIIKSFKGHSFIDWQVNHDIDNGKWIDEKWSKIMASSKEIKDYYNAIIEKTKSNYERLPNLFDVYGRRVSKNHIWEYKKNINESIAEDGYVKTFMSKLNSEAASLISEDITYPEVDLLTGHYNIEPTLATQLGKDMEDKSGDLSEVLLKHTLLTETFLAKNNIYPKIQAIREIVENAKFKKGNQLVVINDSNAKTMLDYLMLSYFRDTKKLDDRFLQRDTLILSEDDKKIKVKLEKEISDLKNKKKKANDTIESIEKGTFTNSKKENIDLKLKLATKVIEDLEASLAVTTDKYNAQKIRWDIEKAVKTKISLEKYLASVVDSNKKIIEGADKQIKKIEQRLNNLGSTITGSAVIDSFGSYTRKLGLVGNLANSITDIFHGFVSNLAEASAGSYFGLTDILSSYVTVIPSVASGQFVDNKLTKMAKMLNIDVTFSQRVLLKELGQSTAQKLTNSEGAYKLQELSGSINEYSTMLAILKKRKIKVMENGVEKEVTIWDCFDENANWKFKDTPNPLKAFDNEGNLIEGNELFSLSSDIQYIVAATHGNPKLDKPIYAKNFVFGRAAFIFRSWLPTYLKNRLGGYEYDPVLGMKKRGMFRTLFGSQGFMSDKEGNYSLKSTITNFAALFGLTKSEMTAADQANMRKLMVEIAFLMVLKSLMAILTSIFEDEEDEESQQNLRLLLNQTSRITRELSFLLEPESTLETFGSGIFPATRSLGNLLDLVNHTAQYTISNPLGITDYNDEIERGINSGESKIENEFWSSIPIINQIRKHQQYSESVYNK